MQFISILSSTTFALWRYYHMKSSICSFIQKWYITVVPIQRDPQMIYSNYKNMTKKQQKKWILSQEDKPND